MVRKLKMRSSSDKFRKLLQSGTAFSGATRTALNIENFNMKEPKFGLILEGNALQREQFNDNSLHSTLFTPSIEYQGVKVMNHQRMRGIYKLALLPLIVVLVGCSAMRSQTISVRTTPGSATVELPQRGGDEITPCSFDLMPTKDYLLRISKDGYKSETIRLKRKDDHATQKVFLSIIFFPIGLLSLIDEGGYCFEKTNFDIDLKKTSGGGSSFICGSCGEENAEGGVFCGGCGRKTSPPEPSIDSGSSFICRSCGEENAEGGGFCGGCGRKTSPPEPKPIEEPTTDAPPFCKSCGKENPRDSKFCNGCGKELPKPKPIEEPTTDAPPLCKSCGKENPEGSKFCNGCGRKIPEPKPKNVPPVCEGCEKENPIGSKFCNGCGKELTPK